MHFPGRKTYVLVVEKVHFQKSDVFLNVGIVERRLIQSDRRLIQTGPQTYSENLQFGVEIHGVSENVPGAAAFYIIFACETLEIHAFLSSPTWNLIGESINPIILVRSKKMGSAVCRGRQALRPPFPYGNAFAGWPRQAKSRPARI